MISILEEIRSIKSGRKELREFGGTIGAVLLGFSGIALWRGRDSALCFLICGLLFIGAGLMTPALLKPFQKIWMGFAAVMGFVMSRVILALLFFGVLTPIGLAMKLFGKDLLDERVTKERQSYWIKRPDAIKPRESYENQY